MNFQPHLDNTPIIVLISLQFVVISEFGSFVLPGFIMMCPQLFINYKLKSVAHLPWRQMTYKFLNTIIDDLFAFVIKMPTLHRLSVFRDGEKTMDPSLFLFILWKRRIYLIVMPVNLLSCRCHISYHSISEMDLPGRQETYK